MSFRFNKFGLIILLVVLAVLISGLVSAPAQAAMQESDLPVPSFAPVSPLATTWVVTSSADSGFGTLRAAMAAAASGDTITFNGDMTITLSSELIIDKSLTIDGETHMVTVSGNHATRVFNVTAGHITFARLTIANGNVQTTDCGDWGVNPCGGGIMLQNSGVVVTVTQTTLISNTASSMGGGIFNSDGSTLTVVDSTLVGNTSGWRGGGISNRFGLLTLVNSTLSGNSSTYGGGLYTDSRLVYCYNFSYVTLTNNTFSGNSAAQAGGAIYNSYGMLGIDSNTIVSNTAPSGAGGGIRSFNDTMTCTRVGSSLIAGNSGSDVAASSTQQRFYSQGYNVIGTAGANVDFNLEFKQTQDITNVITPLLAPLAANGGGTWTHAVLPDSPTIDRGSAACPTTDQRGVIRPQGTTCDSGAFELEQYTLRIGVAGNGSGVVTPTVGSHFYLTGTATTVPITATASVSSSFVSWSGDLTGNINPTAILVDADKIVTATFALQTFTITPTASANGAIAPATPQMVNYGDSITFTLAAKTGYHVADVGVDGVSQGPIGSYTFHNVQATHTITGAFAIDPCSNPIVTSNADDGVGSLRYAIACAALGDTITFNGNMTITLASELVISQSVTIDGEAHAVTISGNHATRVFNVTASAGPISFAHLTIADGDVQTLDCGDPYNKCGGGIMLHTSGVAVTVTNSTLISNTAYSLGGSIYNAQGRLNVQNSMFVGNRAGGGGGIYNSWGQVTMTNTTFSGNSTSGTGGGLYSYAGIVNVSDSSFLGNGDSTANQGGAIFNNSSIMTVTNSTFSGNFIQVWGGAISNYQGPLTIVNSTFSDNRATLGQGGGIKNWSGVLNVINSTFSGNSAYEGGGLLNDSGTLIVLNSTFSGNAATNGIGNGLENWSGTTTVTNSIVANSLSGVNCAGSLGGTSNLADDTTCGAGFINSSTILLGPLGNYTCPGGQCQGGGSTPTFPLLPGSAAINATSVDCPATDQRAITRGSTCDLGAFESRGFTLIKAGGDSQPTLVNTVFTQHLAISVTSAFSEPVNGGLVTFAGPHSGAGINPITTTATITNGAVAHGITANGLPGSYPVEARASGAAPITFTLTNIVRMYLPLLMK